MLLRQEYFRKLVTPCNAQSIRFYGQARPLPTPPHLSTLGTPEDSSKARAWINQFKDQSIPRNLVELSFSRSSGPGGQNVNKVNTKATLRCSASAEWIPLWARSELIKSPQYAPSSQSILITSSTYRSQAQNIEDCLSKLHSLILSASSANLKKETPEEKKKHVVMLQRSENERRMKEKMRRKSVKQSRGKPSWD
ncbi:peptidyl-trna hydrolase domain protein [Moniliophthora roreri]|uniref:Prokaryotic-type class I peptide chain release factors domain-containing protein n=1 Tax=Moniliophthora roreri TaxID=221103 RepID=A0A0W0F7I3_MONRR|nr:peptidyl-trna hydrolase domain protein [Moniliophthora roreri]